MSRFLQWTDQAPMHGWWIPVAIYVALVAWGHAVLWLSGAVPPGTRSDFVITASVYGPYSLVVLRIANAVARRSLRAFWWATGWPDEEQAEWSWRLSHAPAGPGPVLLVVGIALAAGATVAGVGGAAAVLGGDRTTALLTVVPSALAGYAFFPFMFNHTVHQLRLVSRIHREATRIDPFDRGPIYAFSQLTGLTSVLYLAAAYFAFTINGAWQAGNVVGVAVLVLGITIGVAFFVWPLWGIHERLVHGKAALVRDAERRVSEVADELYRRVDSGKFDATKEVADTYAAVAAARERVSHLPTWPWPPQLLRGVVTALLLPVVVYIVSRGIGGLIGT